MSKHNIFLKAVIVLAALLVLLFADNWNIVDQAVVFIKNTYDNALSVYLGNVVSGDPGMFFAASVFYLDSCVVGVPFGTGLSHRGHRPFQRESIGGDLNAG